MSNELSKLIFQEWKTLLSKKDRSFSYVESNFEELFQQLKDSGVDFNEAHSLLPGAIKAHQPHISLARKVYQNIKKFGGEGSSYTEKEFIEKWNEDIANKGSSAFFSIYPVDKPVVKEEPKMYGKLTLKEHRQQLDYLKQFPVLNTSSLEKNLNSDLYNPLDDMKNILGGEDNE